MDSLINAAAAALAHGDPLQALKRVALREDPPALALRGIAMAQLGDFGRSRTLLRAAARAFGPAEALARARCVVAQAEVALASRDLAAWSVEDLAGARALLEARGDRTNAAHAGYLEMRRLVLIGRLDEAEQGLSALDPAPLPPALRAAHGLVVASLAMRRWRATAAREALEQVRRDAAQAGIPFLTGEVEALARRLDAPAARLIAGCEERPVDFAGIEALGRSGALIVDGFGHLARKGESVVNLARRPVLFELLRALAEAWPADVSRQTLAARAFGAREVDESHRVRLRVEIGRLRGLLGGLGEISATRRGFALSARQAPIVAVLARPAEGRHAVVLALLSDGEAWSSTALAIALDASPRTIQRALEVLAAAGEIAPIGRGRARRWTIAPPLATSLLLPPDIRVG
jgi:DNA-binding winged helix-turn-helix (wHTH) protein